MWNLFSRDPSKDFAYEVGDAVRNSSGNSFWVQHSGKKRATGESVSVFRYEIKPGEESYLDLAKNCLKRLKTLRHPSVLTFLDSLETDKYILIVTEEVEPLYTSLSNMSDEQADSKDFSISWGLLSVCKGLAFLNNDCNLVHGNLNADCIFVNNAGDWKISNFEYMSNIDESYPYQKYYSHKIYTAPELRQSKTLNKAVDTWGLGCLIWEIYNGQMSAEDDVKQVRKITKRLANLYPVLMSQTPKGRPTVQDFIKKASQANGFFNNIFIETMVFLEEFQIKDSAEKNRYFSSLNNRIDSIPPYVCKNKILPLIITGLEYGDTGSNMLELFFKIGKTLSDSDFQKRMVPCILKLFSSKDRSVRSKLLKEMESYAEKLPQNLLNEQMFPNLLQGFLDSNPIIREQTVKSISYLAPKLSASNLNEEVIKHFSRLQFKDPEGGIRTNTIVCMGRIADHLSPTTRQTVMLPAFLRSLRDPFPPSRIAGINSLLATQEFFTLQDISGKVMPSLCTILMDPESKVREIALSTLKEFMSKMERFSEDPSQQEQMESQINHSGSNAQTKLSFGLSWAVSSLASKITRGKAEEQKIVEKISALSTSESINSIVGNDATKSTPQETPKPPKIEKAFAISDNPKANSSTTKNITENSNKTADGWDDGWDEANDNNFNDIPDNMSQVSSASKDSSTKFQVKADTGGWEENFLDDESGWGSDLKTESLPDWATDPAPAKPVREATSARKKPAARANASGGDGAKGKRGPLKLGAKKL